MRKLLTRSLLLGSTVLLTSAAGVDGGIVTYDKVLNISADTRSILPVDQIRFHAIQAHET